MDFNLNQINYSQSRYTSRSSNEEGEKLTSLTNEFYFVIYSTHMGNRKTMAIFRNIDSEMKEVNLILKFKDAKNIGKKIKKAIAELKARPINKLYQTYMQYLKSNYPVYSNDFTLFITAIDTANKMKFPYQTLKQVLVEKMNDDNYKHDYIEYVKRVCRTCLNFGDCVLMNDIPICDACKNNGSFDQKYRNALNNYQDARAAAVGGISQRKYQWCKGCDGGDLNYDRVMKRNEFGSHCKNPDCQYMNVCDVCKTILSDDCFSKGHDYNNIQRFVSFDLATVQRVCRVCLKYGDCQIIGKKPLCKNCKQLRIERTDKNFDKNADITICMFCNRDFLPSHDVLTFGKLGAKAHKNCLEKFRKDNHLEHIEVDKL